MKKKSWKTVNAALLCAALGSTVFTCPVFANDANEAEMEEIDTGGSIALYRMYNMNSGEHFYTANASERDHLYDLGWEYEGTGWYAPERSSVPVYRLYNPNAGDHHYTMNAKERDHLKSVGWKDEGVCWYSDEKETVPLYRQYNPNARAGAHNYTTSANEKNYLIANGWRDENIGWYGTVAGQGISREEAYKKVYQPCVDHARDVLKGKSTTSDYGVQGGTPSNSDIGIDEMRMYKSPLYYSLTDMNGDGIPELAICTSGGNLLQLFTASAHKPVFVLYSYTRSTNLYLGGNQFMYAGSGGAARSYIGRFHLNRPGAGYTWDEYFFSQPDNSFRNVYYYTNTTGSGFPEDSRRISASEFRKASDRLSKPSVLKVTPLENWRSKFC